MMRPAVAALLLLAAFAFSEPGWSQAPVRLTVQVIHASNAGTAVDPALVKIRAQLGSMKYSFRVICIFRVK